jgi:hypothetical protein
MCASQLNLSDILVYVCTTNKCIIVSCPWQTSVTIDGTWYYYIKIILKKAGDQQQRNIFDGVNTPATPKT